MTEESPFYKAVAMGASSFPPRRWPPAHLHVLCLSLPKATDISGQSARGPAWFCSAHPSPSAAAHPNHLGRILNLQYTGLTPNELHPKSLGSAIVTTVCCRAGAAALYPVTPSTDAHTGSPPGQDGGPTTPGRTPSPPPHGANGAVPVYLQQTHTAFSSRAPKQRLENPNNTNPLRKLIMDLLS